MAQIEERDEDRKRVVINTKFFVGNAREAVGSFVDPLAAVFNSVAGSGPRGKGRKAADAARARRMYEQLKRKRKSFDAIKIWTTDDGPHKK